MRAKLMPVGGQVVVGQKVYCGLYGGNDGIVVEIKGHQLPATVRHLVAGVSMGGASYFNVLFPNHLSQMVPECIVRGVQWEIYDEVATEAEITQMRADCAAYQAAAKAKEEADAVRRAAERVQHAADNPHLLKVRDKPDWAPARLVAANIRTELKRSFPTTKFSVVKDGYNTVRVKWTDGPTSREVQAVTGRFEHGSFDGMTDSYSMNADATFADVFGGVSYVSESRDATVEGVRAAWVKAATDPTRPGHCGWGTADEIPDQWWNSPRQDEFHRTWAAMNLVAA